MARKSDGARDGSIYGTQCKCSPGPKVEKAGSRRSEGHTFWGDILVSGRHSVSLGKAKCALDYRVLDS